jgi:gas vesicle protein
MFIIGTVCGVTIGTAVALLVSPMSGEAMREEAHARFEGMLEDAQAAATARRVELEAEYADLTTRH